MEDIFGIIFKVVAGLGIFLLGMQYMSEGLQTIAGNRLRKMIGMVTNNRFMATGVGTAVTCLVQSSSVTTVMVVGFVNAGFMTLSQAIGVIMGANIGTTITGWIIALNIGKHGLPILGIAALFFRFSKRDKVKFLAMAIMGIGMVFFGLELMKNGFKPIRNYPEFNAWFARFVADSYLGVLKCAMVGCILTMIVQSSSATLGITIGLASTGVIPFETAAALVLGENIGTTITALLASIGTTQNAKRAAYAHCMFNLLGVAWITALFPWYIEIVKAYTGFSADPTIMANGESVFHVEAPIAAVHTGFNVVNTLLFLPFTQVMASMLMKFVPDRKTFEAPHLTMLDERLLATPSIGLEQAQKEIDRMAETVENMLDRLKEVVQTSPADDRTVRKIFHREEIMDTMQKEVTEFLTVMLSGNATHDQADEARGMLRMADEYESLSDYCANIVKLTLRLEQAGYDISDEDREKLLKLHNEIDVYVKMINKSVHHGQSDILVKARAQGDGITHLVRQFRSAHMDRVSSSEKPIAPLATVIFVDTLNAYRRVKDHAMNVAEALAGEK